ncbi:restriction endonuclease subunit S [Lactococcus cremoris]|jgi:type I restriction enzyme S subunit|nr:restriction endonuclease subunit S [Lactococcus cremoris]
MVGTMAKIDDSVKKKVPELRFPGFTDDWEERKLSDIVVRLTKSSNNNQLPKVEFEDIIAGEGRLNKDISRKFDDRKGTLFEPDNILYGKLRPYLKNWLFSDFKGIALGDFWVFKSKNSEPKFVYSLIQADNYQRVANDTSGTKMPRSDWKKVSSSNFSIPTSLEEQQKIGSFFKQLDNTIALHQRKLDLLKEQKKGYLQKMFPKNGEKVPELRFAGFADDWEERKLGELGSVAMNRRIFKDQTSENEEVPFFKIGTFGSKPDAFISRELFEEYKLKYPYPEIGDILISASGSIGRTVVYQGEDEYFQDSNIVWLKHDNRLDNKFLKQFYSIVKWQGLEGSTIKRLYNKNILDTDISIPSTIEQNKIGMFFEQLDDTIALHQRKLDLLKEQKKGFLQKMFV